VPKIVDPQARRDEVLAAAWRVIERDGLQGATIRAIATEAGASTAVVTHYFRNKDEVLHSALDLSHERIGERRKRNLVGLAGMTALKTALLHMLPLDAERRLELHIEVNFWGRAISDETSREQHLTSHDRSLRLLTDLVGQAMAFGEVADGLDPRRVAEGLLAFIDGLGVDALMHPNRLSPASQHELLLEQLARLGPASNDHARRPTGTPSPR
jgi:AcrR family transcriptional regulator